MTYQTSLLFNASFPPALYVFVLSGSVTSYNFHWYLTPPHAGRATHKQRWHLSNRRIHLLLFFVGLAGAAVSSFLLIGHWFWLGITALLTFLYSAPLIKHPLAHRLRRIAVGKTIFQAFAWMHVTALLPLLITTTDLVPSQVCFGVNRFFFLYAVCIIFDRRDVEGDRRAGVKSLVTLFDDRGVDGLFWSSLVVALLTNVLLCLWLPAQEALLLAWPLLLLALLYRPSKKTTSDYLYYFVLDGLMALSAPMLILLRFAR